MLLDCCFKVIFVPHGMNMDQLSDREDTPKTSGQKARTMKVKQLFDYFDAEPRIEIEKSAEKDPVCNVSFRQQ